MLLTAIIVVTIALHVYLADKRVWFALITALLGSFLFVWLGAYMDNILNISLAPGLFVATLATALLARPETTPDGRTSTWPQNLAISLLVALVIALLIVSIVLIPPVGLALAALGAVATILLVRYLLVSRQVVALQVMSTIGACMRQNLPLAPALQAAGAAQKDQTARTLLRISHWLTHGYPLSDAIRRGYPRCPGDALALISMAEHIDQLPLALKCLEADILEKTDRRRSFCPVHPLYPLIILTLAFYLIMGMMYFIIPKYRQLFADFGATLPRPTLFLITFFTESMSWSITLLTFLLLLAIPVGVYAGFRPRRADRPHLLSRLGDWIKWRLPFTRRFEKISSLLHVVELLRLSLRAGSTVDKAIEAAAHLDVNLCFRKRLRRWYDGVIRGEDVAMAATRCGLGPALAWAFDSKVNAANTPAVLEDLEQYYRFHYAYLANLARSVMWPLIIVALAATVGFVVYALFVPVVALIEQALTWVV